MHGLTMAGIVIFCPKIKVIFLYIKGLQRKVIFELQMTKNNQVNLSEIITDEVNYMDSESKKGSIIFGRYYKKGPLCTSTLDLEVCK